jgi:hypothetical protein
MAQQTAQRRTANSSTPEIYQVNSLTNNSKQLHTRNRTANSSTENSKQLHTRIYQVNSSTTEIEQQTAQRKTANKTPKLYQVDSSK